MRVVESKTFLLGGWSGGGGGGVVGEGGLEGVFGVIHKVAR